MTDRQTGYNTVNKRRVFKECTERRTEDTERG